MKKRVVSVLTIGILIGFLTGCEASLPEEKKPEEATDLAVGDETPEASFISMEEVPVLDYDVPKSLPHILIDQLGYTPGSEKVAIFFGEELPKTFEVKNVSDGSTAYEGKIENVRYSELYRAKIGYGDFSSLKEEGQYSISAKLLGSSYEFSVEEDLYDELFREACRTFYYNRCGMTLTEILAGENAHNACHTDEAVLRKDMTVRVDVTGGWHQDGSGSKNIAQAAAGITNLLLSYEIFPGAFDDASRIPESGNGVPDILDEIKYETDWMLKMQDNATGAVYSAVTVNLSQDKRSYLSYVEDPTVDAAYAYAAVLSKFSFLYQDFDRDYATVCLKAADRAWKYALLSERNAKEPVEESLWKFPAAAEIYRASASKDCERFLNEYLEKAPYSEGIDNTSFYGYVTYLNTRQKVNTRICEDLIRVIMQRAEDISADSRAAVFSVPASTDQTNNAQLLNNMMTMTLVDHIISNHEYDTIIENYMHYFLGRNAMSVVYLDHVGSFSYRELHEGLGLMKQFDTDSMLIFMLSKIKTVNEKGTG